MTPRTQRTRNACPPAALLALFIFALSPRIAAQEPSPVGEVVANLAAGRVVIAVTRDGIAIATLETPVEPSTRPPQIVALSGRRAAILLGAVQWQDLTNGNEIARLSNEIGHLRAGSGGSGSGRPTLQPGGAQVSSELEAYGLGLLERLRKVAESLHSELHLALDEPLVELIITGYDAEEGAEAWLLRYPVKQMVMNNDYWQTTVMRPSYNQLWPPEKGQPKYLVEVRYPPEDAGPSIQEMLRANDKKLAAIRASDAAIEKTAAHFADGESQKATLNDATQFLRAAFSALAPPTLGEEIAVISTQTGFDWIVAPPLEKRSRPSGAPTLQKP